MLASSRSVIAPPSSMRTSNGSAPAVLAAPSTWAGAGTTLPDAGSNAYVGRWPSESTVFPPPLPVPAAAPADREVSGQSPACEPAPPAPAAASAIAVAKSESVGAPSPVAPIVQSSPMAAPADALSLEDCEALLLVRGAAKGTALTDGFARITSFNGGSRYCSRDEMAHVPVALARLIALAERGAGSFSTSERVPDGEPCRLVFDVDGGGGARPDWRDVRGLASAIADMLASPGEAVARWTLHAPPSVSEGEDDDGGGPDDSHFTAVVLTRKGGSAAKWGAHIVFPHLAVDPAAYRHIALRAKALPHPLATLIDPAIAKGGALNLRMPWAFKGDKDSSQYTWDAHSAVVRPGVPVPPEEEWDPRNVAALPKQVARIILTVTPHSPPVFVATPVPAPDGAERERSHGHASRGPLSAFPALEAVVRVVAASLDSQLPGMAASRLTVTVGDRVVFIDTNVSACPNLVGWGPHRARTVSLRVVDCGPGGGLAFDFSCRSENSAHPLRVYRPDEVSGGAAPGPAKCESVSLRTHRVFGPIGTRLGELIVGDDGLLRLVAASTAAARAELVSRGAFQVHGRGAGPAAAPLREDRAVRFIGRLRGRAREAGGGDRETTEAADGGDGDGDYSELPIRGRSAPAPEAPAAAIAEAESERRSVGGGGGADSGDGGGGSSERDGEMAGGGVQGAGGAGAGDAVGGAGAKARSSGGGGDEDPENPENPFAILPDNPFPDDPSRILGLVYYYFGMEAIARVTNDAIEETGLENFGVILAAGVAMTHEFAMAGRDVAKITRGSLLAKVLDRTIPVIIAERVGVDVARVVEVLGNPAKFAAIVLGTGEQDEVDEEGSGGGEGAAVEGRAQAAAGEKRGR